MSVRISLASGVRLASSVIVIGAGALVGIADCYHAVESQQCCVTYQKECPGNTPWNCDQTHTAGGGPFTIQLVMAGTQAGKTGYASSTVGTCTMVYQTCGPTPGDCIPLAPSTLICRTTVPVGATCNTGGGGQ